MQSLTDIYFSIDDARIELKKRWADTNLKKTAEKAIGSNSFFDLQSGQRAVLNRHLTSPDNGFTFFYQSAKYLNIIPFASEYLGDIFIHLNEEKKGLGRLHVKTKDGIHGLLDILDFKSSDKQPLTECMLKTGEKLVDFHHSLLDFSGYKVDIRDNTRWFQNIGSPDMFYYNLFLHFVCHGALFETFLTGINEKENDFTHKIVLPALEKVQKEFGISPILIHLYPQDQTEDEDQYWWSYPPLINEQLLRYADENKLAIKFK